MSDWYATGYVKCRRDRALQAHIVSELMAENAALWEFVNAMDSGDWDGDDDVYDAMTATRDALRKYEKE